MQNSPTATRNSFVSPQEQMTPSRDLNANGKRYITENSNTDPFATRATPPSIPRISTRDSILSRTSTFSHTNNSYSPFINNHSRRNASSPTDIRRLSIMSLDTQGSTSNSNRLHVLVKSLDEFESFFKQQLRLGNDRKRGDIVELNKQCKQRISLLKQQINQVSEQDISSEDVMKEAQARVEEVFKESENWKGQASNANLHLHKLEKKMNDMAVSYQTRLKTLVDELEQSKKLLERYENQELNEWEPGQTDENANKRAREDAQKISNLELENLQLKRELQEKEGDLTGKISQISNQYSKTTSRIDQLSDDLKEERARVKQLKEYLNIERSEKTQLNNDLTSERAHIQTLELEHQSTIHQYREAMNSTEKEIRDLKYNVDVLSEEKQRIKNELELATSQQSDSLSRIKTERDDLKRETKEMKDKLEEWADVYQRLKSSQDQLQSLLEKERNKSHKLKSDLDKEQIAAIQSKEKVHALTEEKSSLQRQLDLATTHQSESIGKITQERNSLLGQVNSLNHQLEEANDNINRMSLDSKFSSSQLQNAVSKNEQLSKDISEQIDRANKYSADFSKAVDDLKQAQRTMEDLRLAKHELEKELESMMRDTRQQSENHVQLTTERNSLKRRVVDLEHQLDTLEASKSEHEQKLLQEIQSKSSDLQRYSEQLKQSKQRIEELNQNLADKSTRLDRVSSDLENARLQLQRSKMNEESIVQTKSNLTQRLEETAASLNLVVKEAAERDVEIARLESVRVDTRTHLQNALAQHAKLEARIDQLEADLKQKDSALSQFSDLSLELLEAADYAHKLETVIERKEHELVELEQEAQALITERGEELKRVELTSNQKIDQLQTRIESLRNKLASTENALKESVLENTNLEKTNSDLEMYSENMKQALSKCERQLKEIQADMARKTRDLSELQYKYEHERDLVDDLTDKNAKLQEETKMMEHRETEIEVRARKIEKLEDTVNKILTDLAAAMEKKRATEERSKHFEEMASKIKAEAQDRIHDLEFKCTEAQREIDDKERDLQNIRKLLREALRER